MQRENEGGVTQACRKYKLRKRGPVLFLCIVPPLVFVVSDVVSDKEKSMMFAERSA